MSGEKQRIPLAEATSIARELAGVLGPYCERLEIAGSIRRQRPDVGDVEIVCVPKLDQSHTDLFGVTVTMANRLDTLCEMLVADETFQHRRDVNGRPAFGERLKRLTYRGVALDLFSVLAPAQWGVIYAIRTGPADFSHRLVTPRTKGGLLPDWLKVRDGAIWHGDHPIETPSEEDVFKVIGLDYIPPERRTGLERAAVAR